MSWWWWIVKNLPLLAVIQPLFHMCNIATATTPLSKKPSLMKFSGSGWDYLRKSICPHATLKSLLGSFLSFLSRGILSLLLVILLTITYCSLFALKFHNAKGKKKQKKLLISIALYSTWRKHSNGNHQWPPIQNGSSQSLSNMLRPWSQLWWRKSVNHAKMPLWWQRNSMKVSPIFWQTASHFSKGVSSSIW